MKRQLAFLIIAAMPLVAQSQKPSAAKPATVAQNAPVATGTAPATPIVANVNGEVITKAKLDYLYDRMNAQMRAQYEKSGGKAAFLDNYLRKRLVVQEALKSGFDKRPEVQADIEAARESAIFDRYVRDIVASSVVTESEIRKFYDENPNDFVAPAKIKARHILIMTNGVGPKPKSKAEAADMIQRISADLNEKLRKARTKDAAGAKAIAISYFSQAAKAFSEDGAAQSGGDLGWMPRGSLDSKFEEVAYALPIGTVSPAVETRYGYHLIMVEDKQTEGTQPYEEVRGQIRDFLLSDKMSQVMEQVTRLTNDLRSASRVAIYPENVR